MQGATQIGKPYHCFPTLEALGAEGVEVVLRNELGFGYRSKYICNTAKMLLQMQKENGFCLNQLRELSSSCHFSSVKYEKEGANVLKEQLQRFPGVGPKVADCVALFSLDCTWITPIDTHIHKIACCIYKLSSPKSKSSSLTKKAYEEIGLFFYRHFGELSGWAHTVRVFFLLCEEFINLDFVYF